MNKPTLEKMSLLEGTNGTHARRKHGLTVLNMGITALLAFALTGCGDGRSGEASKAPDFRTPDAIDTAPAEIVDLRQWMLTLPVDSEGGNTGPAAHVSAAALGEGYRSEWFYGSETDGQTGVSFWAPVNGAATERSQYARSELREMLDTRDASVNWTADEQALLRAALAVNQTPLANGKVIVGQILGYNGTDPNISELAKLIYEYNHNERRATLYALVMDNPFSGATATRIELTRALRLNEPFAYTIEVRDRQVHVSTGEASGSAAISSAWNDIGLFFRAGVALLARDEDPTDGGRVTFFELAVEHPA